MHLGIKNFIGGPTGTLFGDGTYSGNIYQSFTNTYEASSPAVDANVWVDNLNPLPAGSKITHLAVKSTAAGFTQKLYVLRDNGSYNYTTVVELPITTVKAGWNYYTLPAAYDVPETGRYVVAFYGNASGTLVGTNSVAGSVYGAAGGLPLGSSATFTYTTNYMPALGYQQLLQPRATYDTYLSDIAPQATLSCVSTVYASYSLSNLVDGNNTTGGSAIVNAGVYGKLIFAYSNAVEIRRVVLSCNFGSGNQAVKLMHSDDGTAWSDTDGVTMSVPYNSTIYTFDKAAYGSHRFWALQNITTGGYIQFTTVELRELATLTDAIVITGAATVAPDSTTVAASYSCQNLVLDGAAASLTTSTNCKGLFGVVKERVIGVNGAKAHMNGKGIAGNFGNLTPYDLISAPIRGKLSRKLKNYVFSAEGANGASPISFTGTAQVDGLTGSAAVSMQTGGGGGGGARLGSISGNSSSGGKGGTCCGGGGGGGLISSTQGVTAAVTPDYGQGGAGNLDTSNIGFRADGGSGNPVGASVGSGAPNTPPVAGGGGILGFICPQIDWYSGCVASSDGTPGAGSNVTASSGSGSSGGGITFCITLTGGLNNQGTFRASGGALPVAASYGRGGPGGAGSVNTFTVPAGTK